MLCWCSERLACFSADDMSFVVTVAFITVLTVNVDAVVDEWSSNGAW